MTKQTINTVCYTLVASATLFALGYETVPIPPGTESEPVINYSLTEEQHCSREGMQGNDIYCPD
jgi:hypothetical protein